VQKKYSPKEETFLQLFTGRILTMVRGVFVRGPIKKKRVQAGGVGKKNTHQEKNKRD